MFGLLMGLFEVNYTKYARKRSHRLNLKKLVENGEGILDKNFAYEHEGIINSLEHVKTVYNFTVLPPVCTPEGLIYP